MKTRRVMLSLVASVAVWAAAAGQPLRPPGVAVRAATRPAGPSPGAFDDRWLGRTAVEKLGQYSGTGEYAALASRLKSAMLARLSCGHVDRLAALTEMVYALRACAYLPMAEKTAGGEDMVRWLVGHKEVAQTLFRAVEDAGEPDEALEAFWELVSADAKTVLSHPDLAVAFATSGPLRHYRPQPEACSMLEAFRWYTRRKGRMRYDLKKMPYEISRYLATTRLSLSERRWAVKQYRDRANPAKAYFDLEYDEDHAYRKKPKKIADRPYTLPSLRKTGGVCIEQAYYAVEVCRAMGIPAAIVRGTASWGGGHAWAACLRIGGRRAYWDSTTGRYAAHRYFTGAVRDPATGRTIQDAEMMLVGAAAQLPRRRRREADAAVVLARMVDRLRDDGPAPALPLLRRWAREHDSEVSGDGGHSKASVTWLTEQRKIDRSLVEDLLAVAIDRNLACKPAWELLVELRRSDRLPAERLGRFFDILVSRTAREYPDYSCSLVMRIIPTIPAPAKREKVYRKALAIYGKRPDLYGRILIALGDDYAGRDDSARALKAYEAAALKTSGGVELMLAASAKAEKLLRASGRTKAAITMYRKLMAKAGRRWKSRRLKQKAARATLGSRLVALLREIGRKDEADRIEKTL